ncbi:amiloride-sensitive sodium channel subunit beta [Strongylocentrotus purpuratus]|uniref:Uncharacterized protein n=1 Tax=Strongylocentrotus purpuratus TaxID=7668 RepID=A0A7M7NJJ3_STRPU|nr:amiloride-sensitive sodium channel subunit beta [Strongylocentrotus purpuratus]
MENGNRTYPHKHGPNTVSGDWVQQEADSVPAMNTASYRDRVSWWAVFYKSVPNAIGIGGMKYAFNSSEVKWRRLFWLLLILVAFCLLLYHVTNRAQYLATYPTSVDIYTNYTDVLTFPTVAFCNYNAYRHSMVAGTELEAFLNGIMFDSSFILNASSTYASFLDSVTMSDLFIEYGHRAEQSIINGRWRSSETLDHTNFTLKITDWGLCFVFNDADSGDPPLTVNRPGKEQGLELGLNVEQYESFIDSTARYSTGFQVLLYDYGTEPLITDQGFAIAPGTHTHVGVEVTETSNLEPPYGLCQDKALKYFNNYGYPECFIECRSDYFYNACGCKFFALPMVTNDEECTVLDYFLCGGEHWEGFVKNHTCDCPVPCHVRSYKPSISNTAYPSAYVESRYSSLFSFPDGFMQDNFCLISIFFKEISIQQVTQNVDYNFFSFLCDMGGSLGLWLGGSILTFFELLDLFGNSIYIHSKRAPNVRK